VERVAHKSFKFSDASAWDVEQHLAMTYRERMEASRLLKARLFPGKHPDVREWHRRQKKK
jgi:hypothetical protein